MATRSSAEHEPEHRRKWWEDADWPGLIAFVMAFGVALGFSAALIMSASARTPPINETTSTLLATLGGAMVGAVATYLGSGRKDQRLRDAEQQEREGPS